MADEEAQYNTMTKYVKVLANSKATQGKDKLKALSKTLAAFLVLWKKKIGDQDAFQKEKKVFLTKKKELVAKMDASNKKRETFFDEVKKAADAVNSVRGVSPPLDKADSDAVANLFNVVAGLRQSVPPSLKLEE